MTKKKGISLSGANNIELSAINIVSASIPDDKLFIIPSSLAYYYQGKYKKKLVRINFMLNAVERLNVLNCGLLLLFVYLNFKFVNIIGLDIFYRNFSMQVVKKG